MTNPAFATRCFLLCTITLLVTGCAAPRAVFWDGSNPKAGHVEGVLGSVINVPTATISALADAQMDGVEALVLEQDSLSDSAVYRHGVRTLVAASLDMPGMNTMASIHVGIGNGLAIGYRREGGANAYALRWQFLNAEKDDWNGGLALQYASSSYSLPSVLGDLQDMLGYSFSRKDITVPMVFSRPLGDKGKYGSLGFGVLAGWTKIEYGFEKNGLYKRWGGSVAVLDSAPEQSTHFFHYGANGLVRLGYKHVWLVTGLTVVYQNYGSYTVPGTPPVGFDGFAILPAAGIEVRI